MNTRVLSSLIVIGVVGAFATGSTLALFNDTETSEDNTFTAGAIDLGIDIDGGPYDGQVIYGQGNNSTAVPAFFNYGTGPDQGPDIKPGDVHERTLSFHVDNNDAWLCAIVENVNNSENGINEPEGVVDDTPNQGELAAMSDLHIWSDGIDGVTPNAGNNQFNPGADGDITAVGPNRTLPTSDTVWPIADSTTNIYGAPGPLNASTTYYMGVEYSLPPQVGNEAQTDSYSADIRFYAVQSRSNEQFSCLEEFGDGDFEFDGDFPNDDFTNGVPG